MAYSEKCSDLQTYWNITVAKCVSCDMKWIKPGSEFTPNCGYVDDGGRRESRTRRCAENSYNDGRKGTCTACTSCRVETRPCNTTADAQCCHDDGKDCHGISMIKDMQSNGGLQPPINELWMASIIILACVVVGALSYFIYKSKKKSLKGLMADGNGNLPILSQRRGEEWKVVLSPQVQAAPLRVVLDDLDVLEELIILLDPEGNSVKGTRHLASYCSFPSTWINYAYSMRDSKSPLKTLLEGVTTRNPDWTVGHLARLLRVMGRSDAIVVLDKLKPDVYAV
ncbi:unnamed protein product [Lota lota]